MRRTLWLLCVGAWIGASGCGSSGSSPEGSGGSGGSDAAASSSSASSSSSATSGTGSSSTASSGAGTGGSSACTLFPQAGCPADQGCDLADEGGTTECRPTTAAGVPGSACQNPSDCAAGSHCFNGICEAFCGADADCGGKPGVLCTQRNHAGTDIPGELLCTDACTPGTTQGCPAELKCVVVGSGTPARAASRCEAAGTGGDHDPCASTADCQNGYDCRGFFDLGEAWCVQICDLAHASACKVQGSRCTLYDVDATFGGVEYGFCEEPCGLVSQTGCQPGTACDLDLDYESTGGTSCREMSPQGVEGQPCTTQSDCAAGETCRGSTGNFTCRKLCATKADCTTGPGATCLQLTTGTPAEPIPGGLICTVDCDPTAAVPPSCLAGHRCSFGRLSDGSSYTSCSSLDGAAALGAACTFDSDCQGGLVCLSSSNTCVQTCVVGGSGCPGTTTCKAFGTPVTIGSTSYGFCQ